MNTVKLEMDMRWNWQDCRDMYFFVFRRTVNLMPFIRFTRDTTHIMENN